MTLHAEGVVQKYKEKEVLHTCSATEFTCTFYSNNQSPCRHILLKREEEFSSLSAVFDPSLFHARYHKDNNQGNEVCMPKTSFKSKCDVGETDDLHSAVEGDQKAKTLSTREKYNMMLPVALSTVLLHYPQTMVSHHSWSTWQE